MERDTHAAFPSVRFGLRANCPACRRVASPLPDGERAGVGLDGANENDDVGVRIWLVYSVTNGTVVNVKNVERSAMKYIIGLGVNVLVAVKSAMKNITSERLK